MSALGRAARPSLTRYDRRTLLTKSSNAPQMSINEGSTFAQSPDTGTRRYFYEFGPYRLDVLNQRLLCSDEPVPITPKTLDLLLVLVRHRDGVVAKRELMRDLWPDTAVEEANLTQQIFTLRKILGEAPAGATYIETVPRRGYRFAVSVREVQEFPDAQHVGIERTDEFQARTLPEAHANRIPFLRRHGAQAAVAATVLVGLAVVLGIWRLRSSGEDDRVMLAVLPFANLSGDPTQEYFSDGLTEAVIAELGRLHPQRLGVIARTSSMAYKGRRASVAEIGRELAVDFVLEGSVRRSQGSVTVTAQLIEVRDQTHRWSRDFDRELRDVVTLQKNIAQAVAQDIRLQLTPEERTRLTAARPVDPKAYEHYLQGRFLWNKRTAEALLHAIERFEQAIAIDPSYALAYAGLADCYGPMVYMGYMSPKTALSKGKPATLRALELDAALAEAHTSLGNFKGSYEWDWTGAEKELVRALELNPSYATGHDWYAQYLIRVGRMEQALAEGARARELDPLSLIISAGRANRLYYSRRYDEAIGQLRKVLDLEPRFSVARWYLGRTYSQQREHAQAIRELEAAAALEPDNPQYLAALGYGYAVAGRRSEATNVLGQIYELSARHYVAPYAIATIYAGLGDREQAFLWLEKSYEERSPLLTFLRVEPVLDSLRSDPRFKTLVRRVGLSEAGSQN